MVPLMSNMMWCSKNNVVTPNNKKKTRRPRPRPRPQGIIQYDDDDTSTMTTTTTTTTTTDDRRYNRAGTQSRYSYGTSIEKRNTIRDLLLQSNVTEEFGRKMWEQK
mmetsp:Transcript_53053/g.57584  ORF Transcript_53053/g.57584 Transcript_53053/m.57584 type:complete len:106 (+) Transcript_53053:270-587(+)